MYKGSAVYNDTIPILPTIWEQLVSTDSSTSSELPSEISQDPQGLGYKNNLQN